MAADSRKPSADEMPGRSEFPGQAEAVRSMCTVLGDTYQEDVVTVKGSVKTGYKTVTIPINKIYSNLILLPSDQLSARVGHASRQGSVADWERLLHAFHKPGQGTVPIQLKDVLSAPAQTHRSASQVTRPPSRILVLACGGAGKTLLTRKATLDWSTGKIWRDKEIVLLFPLRKPEVHKTMRLQQLLEYYGEWSSAELDEMCVYIRKHMHRVCIILDGLDEIDLNACSAYVIGIVTGRRMKGAQVIVTSRPSVEVLDLAGEHPFHRRIEVTGFDKDDVGRYVANVLRPNDAAEVMRQVDGSQYLATFMRIPINAVYICSLYRDGYYKLPTNLPNIVSCMMLAAIKQEQGKLAGQAGKVADTWEKLSSELRQPVLELGKFAFRMLHAKVVVFEQQHFVECQLSQAAQSLGLLVSCEDVGRSKTPQWTFSHLTLQEALAARFISSSLKTGNDVSCLVRYLDPLAGHLNTFWKLLAAELSEECVAALITAILTRQQKPPSSGNFAKSITSEEVVTENSTAAPSTFESRPAANWTNVTYLLKASRGDMLELAEKLSSQLTVSASERLANALLGESDVVDGSGLLAVKAVIPQGSSFLHHLLMLWVRRVPLASVHMLYSALASFDQSVAEQCFPSCALVSESPLSTKTAEPTVAERKSEEGRHLLLLALQCYYEFAVAREKSPAIPVLRQALGSTGMDLEGVHLTPFDCRAVAHALQQYHDIVTKVGLDHCMVGDLGYHELVPGLAKCSRLTYLGVGGNNLTGQHCQRIANLIRQNHTTLRTLQTAGHFTSDEFTLLHSNTHLCQDLTILMIGGSIAEDHTQNVATLSAVLSSCQHLKTVFLYGCAIGDSGLSQLQRHFIQLPLLELALLDIGLSAECSFALRPILRQHGHRMTILALSWNALSDSLLYALQGELAQCSNLRHLSLRDTKITSSSLSILATLLPHWPKLEELYLSDNDFSEGDEAAESFAQALSSCRSLNMVEMPTLGLLNTVLQAHLLSCAVTVEYQNIVRQCDSKEDDDKADVVAEVESEEDSDDDHEDVSSGADNTSTRGSSLSHTTTSCGSAAAEQSVGSHDNTVAESTSQENPETVEEEQGTRSECQRNVTSFEGQISQKRKRRKKAGGCEEAEEESGDGDGESEGLDQASNVDIDTKGIQELAQTQDSCLAQSPASKRTRMNRAGASALSSSRSPSAPQPQPQAAEGHSADKADSTTTVENPWNSEEFRQNYGSLLKLDSARFRSYAFQAGLVNWEESDQCAAMQEKGPMKHNEALLRYGSGPADVSSFQCLLKTLELMGSSYDERRAALAKGLH